MPYSGLPGTTSESSREEDLQHIGLQRRRVLRGDGLLLRRVCRSIRLRGRLGSAWKAAQRFSQRIGQPARVSQVPIPKVCPSAFNFFCGNMLGLSTTTHPSHV